MSTEVELTPPSPTLAIPEFRPCMVIPTFDNPKTVERVVAEARNYLPDILIVDDGSGPDGKLACERVADSGQALLRRRPENGGKGAAVKTGLSWAQELGFSHAVQVDADGQHDLDYIPHLLALGREHPEALVLGCPRYDDSAPQLRRTARKFTQFWIDLEVGRGVIEDAMVGFRLYPIDETLAARAGGNRMDFDVEIPVRMAWRGVPIINLPVPVRYLTEEEGGVSHFQPVWDNVRFSWLHARLTTWSFFRRLFGAKRPRALSSGRELPASPDKDWLSVPERGTLFGMLALVWIALGLGRTAVRGAVGIVAFYYALSDPRTRSASAQWWSAVEGKPPGIAKIYGHIRRFSNVTLDRIFLLADRHDGFVLTRDGHHHLEELKQNKTGAILLGAHLGSFEAMRLGARTTDLTINVVGNFTNARMVNQLLNRLSPTNTARVIESVPGDVGFIFEIQERIANGEMVAILGDRTAGNQPSVMVDFFGRPARFPSGPFMLAALLKCPVYLTFGLFREPNRYELSCEPFAEQIEIPRRRRQEALQETVQRFAHALEQKARQAPDNWFNFFDFWENA